MFLYLFTDTTDPQTVVQALLSPKLSAEATEWKRAMDEEYNSLMKNKTWRLIDLPSGKKALPNKWGFKTKSDQCRNTVCYKARLVINGYAQKKGTDLRGNILSSCKVHNYSILICFSFKICTRNWSNRCCVSFSARKGWQKYLHAAARII